MNTHLNRLQTSGAYLLFVHGRDDRDKEIFAVFESSHDLGTNITLRDLNIVLRGTILSHQVKESIINVDLENTNVQPGTANSFYLFFFFVSRHLQAGIRYAGRWGRPCCA
jgi:hypothetical protein